MNNEEKEIEKLLKRFYSVDLSPEEIRRLYDYFLNTYPIPDKFKDHAPLLQGFGILYYCKQDSEAFKRKLEQCAKDAEAVKRKNILLRWATVTKIAVAAACVAALVVGLWYMSINSASIAPATEVLQSSPNTVLAAQNTDMPITAHQYPVKEKESPQTLDADACKKHLTAIQPATGQNTTTEVPTQQYASVETNATIDMPVDELVDTTSQLNIETISQTDYYLASNETTNSDGKVVSYCSSQCSRKTMMEVLTQVIVM
ncbi:MAG: hypothetical protein IKJ67_00775 [Bacteroidales bacterium]|nr:hypothetical protein [Bacteroidales bacterium]